MKKKNDNENENESLPLNGTEEGEILSRLSERVERAVGLIQELRKERDQLRARVDELEARVADADATSTKLGDLEEETERFRRERGEVRNRIETILASLEALEGEG